MNIKKSIPVMLVITAMLLFAGCSEKQEEQTAGTGTGTEAAKTEAKYDINDIQGFYSAYGGENLVDISVDDSGTMSAVIHVTGYSDSGDRLISEWTMSGDFDPVVGVFAYKDAVKTQKIVEITGFDEGTVTSEGTSPTQGSGRFVFAGEGDKISFTWKEYESDDQDGKEYVFTKDTADLLTPEDLIGQWEKGGGLEYILDIKEDGTLDAYLHDPDFGEGPEYWKEGRWSISGREVCITIGDNEHHLHGDSRCLFERDNPYRSIFVERRTEERDLPGKQ